MDDVDKKGLAAVSSLVLAILGLPLLLCGIVGEWVKCAAGTTMLAVVVVLMFLYGDW